MILENKHRLKVYCKACEKTFNLSLYMFRGFFGEDKVLRQVAGAHHSQLTNQDENEYLCFKKVRIKLLQEN